MASRRRVVWHHWGMGKMLALKKDPTKTSFWIEGFARCGTRDWIHIRSYKIPVEWLQMRLMEISVMHEDTLKMMAAAKNPNSCAFFAKREELVIELLWAEIARRLEKPWLSAKPSRKLLELIDEVRNEVV